MPSPVTKKTLNLVVSVVDLIHAHHQILEKANSYKMMIWMFLDSSGFALRKQIDCTHITPTAGMVRLFLYIQYIRILGNHFDLVLLLFYRMLFYLVEFLFELAVTERSL